MLYIAFVCIFLSIFLFTYNKNHLSKKRYKIFYLRHEVHSYNIIYTNLHNKIQYNNTVYNTAYNKIHIN